MQRSLAFLAILAAILVAISQFLLPGAADGPAGTHAGGSGALTSIDLFSFGLGAAAGACAMILVRLPWHELPQVLADILRIWRRYVVLTTLAAVCMGVLLFY